MRYLQRKEQVGNVRMRSNMIGHARRQFVTLTIANGEKNHLKHARYASMSKMQYVWIIHRITSNISDNIRSRK